MVKIAWKVINGYGPYAYLQETLKEQGKVKSKHLAYLGAAGTNGLIPGKMLTVEAVEDFPGGRVMVPSVGDDTLDALKPKPMAKVQLMHEKVGEGLSKQQVLELLESQPGKKVSPKSPVLSPPVAPVPGVPQVPLKVDQVALDANGKPLITAQSIKKLEAEAAKGDMAGLRMIMYELAEMQKTEAAKWAINYATQDLVNKYNLNQGSFQVVTVNPPPTGVTHPKPEDVVSKPVPERPVQFDKTSTGKVKGVPYLSLNAINVLESLASKGDVDKLTDMLMGSANAQTDEKIKLAVKKAGKDLLEKAYAHQGNPQKVNPDTLKAATPEPPATAADKPIKLESVPGVQAAGEVKYLELLANYGDVPAFDSAVKQLKAQKPNDWVAIAEASNELLNQVYAKKDLKSAPKPIIQGLPTPDPDSPIKLENVPSVLKASDVKKLEKMANEGNVLAFTSATMSLKAKQPDKADQMAIAKAGQELLNQFYAKHSTAKPLSTDAPSDPSPVAPKSATQAAPAPTAPTDEKPIQLDAVPTMGKKKTPLITIPNVKKLEKLANEGDAKKLSEAVIEIAQKQLPNELKQFHTLQAGQELLEKLYAKQGNPQTVYLDDLLAASKVAPTFSRTIRTPVKPVWVQVGPQAGSTPGGLYEDSTRASSIT